MSSRELQESKKKKRVIPKYYGINYPVIKMSEASFDDDDDYSDISEGMLLEGEKDECSSRKLLDLLRE